MPETWVRPTPLRSGRPSIVSIACSACWRCAAARTNSRQCRLPRSKRSSTPAAKRAAAATSRKRIASAPRSTAAESCWRTPGRRRGGRGSSAAADLLKTGNWQLRPTRMKAPDIKTPLPGPNARAIIDRDAHVVSPSYTRDYPFVIARGEGAVVEDVDGNRFLDCAAGIAVNSTGVSHPDVVKAICEQAGKFIHMSGAGFYYEPPGRPPGALGARGAPGGPRGPI